MSSTAKLLLGVLVTSVAMGLGFGIVHTHRAGEPPASERMPAARPAPQQRAEMSEPNLAALSQEVARLREEVAVLAAADATRPVDGSGQALADLRRQVAALQDACASEKPTSDPPTLEEVERDRQAQMEVLEAGFYQEPTDRRWSDRASDAVREALESIDTDHQLEVLSLECRSRSCRVELADDDAGGTAQTLPMFLHQVGETLPNGTASQIEHSNGSRSMILYMTAQPNEAGR